MVTEVSWLEYWSTKILVSSMPSLHLRQRLQVRSGVENVPAGDKVGELGVAVASEQLDAVGRHGCGGVASKVEYQRRGS